MEHNGKQVKLNNGNYKKRARQGVQQSLKVQGGKPTDHRLSKYLSGGEITETIMLKNHERKNPNKITFESEADKQFNKLQSRMFFLENMINVSEHKATVAKCKKELKELLKTV